MFKILKRVLALVAVAAVAIKGVFSFLSWVEKQEELDGNIWSEDEEFEEVQ
ncbi:MAG: hypothetical protein ACO23J_04235 [Candidatus Nanopelagicaceae bacterium]|jgi:hypothetical protein